MLSLCCGCLESVLSLMGPFGGFFTDVPSPVSGDVLPLVSLLWLPHSPFSVSRKPIGSFVLLSDEFDCCARGSSCWAECDMVPYICSWCGPWEIHLTLFPQTCGVQADPNAGVISFGVSISIMPAYLSCFTFLRQKSPVRCSMLQESHDLQPALWRPLTRLEEEGQVLPPLPLVLCAASRPADCWLQSFPPFSHQEPDLFVSSLCLSS